MEIAARKSARYITKVILIDQHRYKHIHFTQKFVSFMDETVPTSGTVLCRKDFSMI